MLRFSCHVLVSRDQLLPEETQDGTKALKQCEMKRCAFGLVGMELSKFVVQLYNEAELTSVGKVVYFL